MHTTTGAARQNARRAAPNRTRAAATLPRQDQAVRLALVNDACVAGRHEEVVALLQGQCRGAAEYANLGISLQALGHDTEAEEAYLQAIRLAPDLAAVRFNYGNLLHAQRRDAEATAAYRAGLELRPDYAKCWNGLGQSLLQQGRLAEAEDVFRRAVQYAPSDPTMHANLGTLLFALDRNAEAADALQRAVALDPGYATAHGNLGALLARSGYPIAAEAACRKAIALAPQEHRWLTNLGVALFAQGRLAEAETCYRQTLAMRPDYADGQGNILFALNYRTDLTPAAIFAEYLRLGSPARPASCGPDGAIHARSDTGTPPAGRLCFGGFPPARSGAVRRTAVGSARPLDDRTVSLFQCRCGRSHH